MLRGKFWKIPLGALLSALLLLEVPRLPAGYSSSACASDSVTFSPQEIDSLTAALDSGETRIRLLRVELDQCRETARIDSLAAANRLRDERQAWYEKVLTHPLVWFFLGAYTVTRIEKL